MPEPEAPESLVVIKTAATAVNPVNLETRSGRIPTSLPAVLGWDLAGTVAHTPAGSGFRTGDRVLAMTAQLVSPRCSCSAGPRTVTGGSC
ncbi:alcohol dehydrogenase catalytic domain-containing protein [Streptomyces sp. NPDC002788]